VKSIVKTRAGQFLNIILASEDSSFQLTVTDRIKRNKKVCDRFTLPQHFIEGVAGTGSLEDVKRAVDHLLKTKDHVLTQDGQLNTGIFGH